MPGTTTLNRKSTQHDPTLCDGVNTFGARLYFSQKNGTIVEGVRALPKAGSTITGRVDAHIFFKVVVTGYGL
jgi:hypothetical protein